MDQIQHQPTQIRCLVCNDGTLMNRVLGTPTHAKYRCAKDHIRQLPKHNRPVQWNDQPPKDAA